MNADSKFRPTGLGQMLKKQQRQHRKGSYPNSRAVRVGLRASSHHEHSVDIGTNWQKTSK